MIFELRHVLMVAEVCRFADMEVTLDADNLDLQMKKSFCY